MTGKRAVDSSPGFGAFVVFVLAMIAVAAILTAYPPREIVQKKPIDACRDGILQQSDGEKWYPVILPRKSHYYDGKKYQPDHPAGHVRTIPCGEE